MSDGVFEQTSSSPDPEGTHNVVLVEGYRAWFDLKGIGDLLQSVPFSQHLQNLSLASRDLLVFLVPGT